MTSRRLAVLGSPIAHSLSPDLHLAAYDVLGLDWTYERVELEVPELEEFLHSRDDSWLGFSLTMPLKYEAARLAGRVDENVALTGACNTLVCAPDGAGLLGVNTDIPALASVIRDAQSEVPASLTVVGSGATAVSAVASAHAAGISSADVFARSPQRAEHLVDVADRLGILVTVHPLDALSTRFCSGLTVITLPGDVDLDMPSVSSGATLIDVAYSPWPTSRARSWLDAGCHVWNGRHMLARQALLQVRAFVTGSIETAVDNEPELWARMRAAIGLAG